MTNAEWKFLGYVSFAPKPGGTARELKVIQVNAVGSFFRLVQLDRDLVVKCRGFTHALFPQTALRRLP